MPKALAGKLFVGSGLFGSYTERYASVKTADSSLKYYKAGDTGGTPVGSIDLRTAEKVVFEEKGGKRDPVKFQMVISGSNEVREESRRLR